MKLTAMILAMAAAGGAHMRDLPAAPGHTVTAYLVDQRGNPVKALGPARDIAVRMFDTVGLKLQWRAGAPSAPLSAADMAVVIELVDQTPVECRPGALAYARAFEGIHLTVFYDRVAALDRSWPYAVLAHVLVHEITHLLEGVAQHSETGVMKARFTGADVLRMR